MAEEALNKEEPPQQFSLGRLLLSTLYFGIGFGCLRALESSDLPFFLPIFAGMMGIATGIGLRRDIGLFFMLGILICSFLIWMFGFLSQVT